MCKIMLRIDFQYSITEWCVHMLRVVENTLQSMQKLALQVLAIEWRTGLLSMSPFKPQLMGMILEFLLLEDVKIDQ